MMDKPAFNSVPGASAIVSIRAGRPNVISSFPGLEWERWIGH